MPKHPRPSFNNDFYYVQAWTAAVRRVGVDQPRIEPPPATLTARFGAPLCDVCWDTGLCPECCGVDWQYCPGDCEAGTCDCEAGAGRRLAQLAHVASVTGRRLP
jgi:hypothetical protein